MSMDTTAAGPGRKRIRIANEGQIYEIEVDDDEADLQQNSGEEDLFKWTRKSTTLLIKTRLQMDTDFQNPSYKKSNLWQKIANVLKANSFYVEPSRCDDKWRNLLQTYRKIKYRPSGTASTWEYFQMLDKGLANVGRIPPPRKYLDTTLNFRNFSRAQKLAKLAVEYSGESSYSEDEDMPTVSYKSSSFSGSPTRPVIGNVSSLARPGQSVLRSSFPNELPKETPPWLNIVMERFEQRDKRAEERESERWNKLMSAIDSLQKAEMEKVKALNNLTTMVEKVLDRDRPTQES